MTTFGSPDTPDFDLNRPGALIAALPAVLGFVPEKSLVLVTVERDEMGCVMRVDLSDAMADTVARVADLAGAGAPEAAIAVIVDEDGAACRMCNDDHRTLADALTVALDDRGIDLLAVHVVDRVAADGRWHCADGCGRGGVVADPSSSPMAAAAVLDGRRLYSNRAELQELIAAGADPGHAAALGGMIEERIAGLADTSRGDEDVCSDVEFVIASARAVARAQFPSDADLARLACGLLDPRVRDMLYALAVGCDAAQAESLWAHMSRTLPDPWRIDALVLLAFSAYARGDGPLAGISLEAALQGDGNHRMAEMLDRALHTGMRPDQIRELGRSGYRLAAQLKVMLPPRQLYGRIRPSRP